jgi:hypothetical protein
MTRLFLFCTVLILSFGLVGQTGVDCPIFVTANLSTTNICADGTTTDLQVDVATTSMYNK